MLQMTRPAVVLALVALLCATLPLDVARAATFTVSSDQNSGPGTLRQAILDSNANGATADTITFSLGAAATWTINLITPLPTLSAGNLTITGPRDGSGRPLVALNGTTISYGDPMNPITAGQGFYITSGGNTIDGLRIYGFGGQGVNGNLYGAGIVLEGTNASNNTITNSYIGTNFDGSAAASTSPRPNNQYSGIAIINSANLNLIENNVISGNSIAGQPHGIFLGNTLGSATAPTANNTIRNNKIGVNAAGTAAVPNQLAGIYIDKLANNNIIGPDNIISGNGLSDNPSRDSDEFGVVIAGGSNGVYSSGNVVRGNRIGLGANNASIPNKVGGVKVNYSANTIVGGTNAPDSASPDRGNIIAGNNRSNVLVTQTNITNGVVALNAQIKNNYIGLRDATTPADNAAYGVRIERQVTNVTVDSNVISGNSTSGIEMVGDVTLGTPSAVTVSNNRIGTNATATATLPGATQGQGVQISSSVSNVTLNGNIITGNRATGVKLTNVSGITLADNRIGGLLFGNTAIGNDIGGISIESSSQITVGPGNRIEGHLRAGAGDGLLIDSGSDNTVKGNTFAANRFGIRVEGTSTNNVFGYGGTSPGATGTGDGNTLVNNQIGIAINGVAALRNRISRTTTTNNIDNGTHKGIVLSGGANAGIPTPSASGLGFSGGNLTGSINLGGASCGAGGCTVEVFQNTVNEPNEGRYFLTSFKQTSSGAFPPSVPISSCMPFLTFTVTDQNNNTSQFSPVVAGPASCTAGEPGTGGPDLRDPSADVTLGAAIATAPQTANFSATLANTASSGTSTFDLVVTPPSGWTAAPVGSVTLNGGASQSVNFSVTAPQNTPAGTYTVRLTATTSGGGALDFIEVRVIVPLVPALSFGVANPATKTGGPNQQVCFTHALANLGNGNDSFEIIVSAPGVAWSPTITPATPVAVARGATTDVTVCVTVPGGTAGGDYAVNVFARSVANNQVFSPTRTDTVQVQDAAVPQLSTAAAQNANPNGIVTFSHRLTNVGNVGATFALTLALPTGWTIVTPPPALTASIAPQAFQDFTYSVRVAADALAGPFSISVTATAQQGANASVTVNDAVNVNQIASLALTASPTVSTEPPNSVVTYTLTLANNGNFTDRVTLAADASQSARGWVATTVPATVEVPARQSVEVKLVVQIPPGQPVSVFNISTVTATSSQPAVTASATVRTNIAAVAGALIEPANPVRPALAGETVTFDFSLLNSGSLPQTFTTVAVEVINTASATFLFTGTTNLALAPGERAPLKLSVVVPAGTLDNTEFVARITATSSPGGATATTLATVRIGPPYDVLVAPDRRSSALPGAIVQYTQYVTNTGRLEDSYSLAVRSSLGWRATVSPSSVRLQPNAGAAVLVTVEVPSSAEANVIDTTVLTARSVADPVVRGSATSATRVLQVAGAVLSPNNRAALVPGRVIAFQHTLLNSGNGRDTYTISVTQTLNWDITIDYTVPPTRHPRGVGLPVQVIVSVPANAPADAINSIIVRATSKFNPAVYSEVLDEVAPFTIQSVDDRRRLYLPLISR